MADIALQRTHSLGLKRAREIAWQWAEQVEQQFGMACTVEEGDNEDAVYFTRSGVNGTLRVTASVFDLQARLGLLLGAFKGTIESEIEKNLDALLAKEVKPAKVTNATKAAAKPVDGKKAAARKKP